jgi:hypothetical protein
MTKVLISGGQKSSDASIEMEAVLVVMRKILLEGSDYAEDLA